MTLFSMLSYSHYLCILLSTYLSFYNFSFLLCENSFFRNIICDLYGVLTFVLFFYFGMKIYSKYFDDWSFS